MKVLIVDDSVINLKVASKILEHEGFTVETSTNGYDSIEKVKNNKYDIIFMDIMMPEMDGKETYVKLQELPNFDTPVVVLTADTEETRDDYLNKYKFAEYLAKPIRIEELKKILNNINIK